MCCYLFAELWVLEDVGEDLDSVSDVLAEAFGVEDGLLPGRVGVQVCAHVLHLQLKRGLGALRGALNNEKKKEENVLL